MRAQAGALLQAGLALKANQIKRATQSYVRDRSAQGQGLVTSYAVAGGLYAAAGIFLIAACLVGVTALFRWIELNYGMFWAFAISGGTLVILTAICAVFAAIRLKRPARQFPGLMSRLRVAIAANPVAPGQADALRGSVATAMASAASTFKPSTSGQPRRVMQGSQTGSSRQAKAGLVLAASLAGWAMARRYNAGRAGDRSRRVDS